MTATATQRVFPFERFEQFVPAIRRSKSNDDWNTGTPVILADEDPLPATLSYDVQIQDDGIKRFTSISPIALYCVLRCQQTRLNKVIKSQSITKPGPVEFQVDVATDLIKGRADLCFVGAWPVKVDASKAKNLPTTAKAILFESDFTLVLERTGHEFPTRWVSFSAEKLPIGALWHLQFDPQDLSLPQDQAIRVLLNKDASAFVRLLGAQGKRPDYRLARSTMLRTIAVSCLASFLTDVLGSEEVFGVDEDLTGTLWESALRKLGEALPDYDWETRPAAALQQARKEYRSQTSLVATRIQDACGLRSWLNRSMSA